MASEKITDPENPEWTEEDFANAKGPESLPPEVLALLPRTKKHLGRPPGSSKVQVTLRIDRDVIARFKATGPGWQSRMNEALRAAKV